MITLRYISSHSALVSLIMLALSMVAQPALANVLVDPSLISLNHTTACAYENGELICWGTGSGLEARQKIPQLSSISIGTSHACTLQGNDLVCYGDNTYSQSRSVFAIVNPQKVYTDQNNTCLLANNQLSCWGQNRYQVLDVPRRFALRTTAFAIGRRHACATNGTETECWGYQGEHLNVPENLGNVAELSVGEYFSCAITGTEVRCWGNVVDENVVPKNLGFARNIQSSRTHTCLMDGRKPVCFKFGTGDIGGAEVVPSHIQSVERIDVGYATTCAKISGGGVECWGSENYGVTRLPYKPKDVRVMGTDRSTCIVDQDGLHCRGAQNLESGFDTLNIDYNLVDDIQIAYNIGCVLAEGKVGCWNHSPTSAIAKVPADLKDISSFAMVNNHICTINVDGTQCWSTSGYNIDQVPPAVQNAKKITLGYYNACAINGDDTVECWGSPSYSINNVPSDVDKVKDLSMGRYSVCVIKEDYTLRCWGSAHSISSYPTNIIQPTRIASNRYNACVIDGPDVICWGTRSQIPKKPVLRGSDPKNIRMGENHVCLTTTAGLECFGVNDSSEFFHQ